MYPQSYSPAQQIDFALLLVFVFAAAVLVVLTLATCWFIWRYHHTRNPSPTDIHGNVLAETLWTVIPFCMVMGLFYYGWTGFKALRTVPPDAMEVQVVARMFSWTFTYGNGKKSAYLAVPEGAAVKLDLRSADVIHSFYAPAFRIKMDTVPGMHTYAWFKGERVGEYDVYCAEYCGVDHSRMMTKIQVLEPAAFTAWLADCGPDSGPDAGKKLMDAQGCLACHAIGDEKNDMGPPLRGLYGQQVTVIIAGVEKVLTADDAYLRESITDPGKALAKGYDNTMPPYTDFSDQQMEWMLEYLRSLAAPPQSGHGGEHGVPQ